MGNGQSSPDPPRTIMIDEWEVPKAYKSVAVSEEVVKVVSKVKAPNANAVIKVSDPQLGEKQRNLITQLKDEVQPLSQVQNHPQSNWNTQSREELEEKKRAFDETVQRVEKTYFGQKNEDFFADFEKDLIRCLKANKSTVLNCQAQLLDKMKCESMQQLPYALLQKYSVK